ncbi:MAG: lysylphosphatidylglycerol synthase transmembrane domain-containing protein, partial [Myxococcota bacterium]
MVRSEPSAPRSGLDVRHLGRIAASIAVTVGLAAWVGARVDRHAIGAILSAARPGWILAAAALGPLQVALSAERWRIASARLGQPIVRERAVREVALSALLNQLLPGGLAGDALRAWRARTAAVTLGPAVRAVIVDRLVGLGVHVAVVGLGLVVWPLVHPSSPPPGAAPVALVVAAALATVPAWPRSVPWIGALAADARTVL